MSPVNVKVPVLFVIFNRPEQARRAFEPIRLYRPRCLYVAADGPREGHPGEAELCERTRHTILARIDWPCEVRTLFRKENVGCGRGVSEGITWMFETEEYGIIVEDDCILSPDFFRVCEELLPRYKDDNQVAQINSCNPKFCGQETDSYYFITYPAIWGWATWARAWKGMDFYMTSWEEVRKRIFKRFSFTEALIHYYFWSKLHKKIVRGEVLKIWDAQWSIYVFMQDKLCIALPANLIVNCGLGGEATNCKDPDSPMKNLFYGKVTFPLRHPLQTGKDKVLEKKRSKEYRIHYRHILFSKIRRSIKSLF